MTARPLGFLASNNSSTRGRPWVISPAGNAARVEGPHRQLRTRLADGLRRDDAYRFADIHRLAVAMFAP